MKQSETVLEGKVQAGKVIELKATPESRRKDVTVREQAASGK